ncbi:uncharacterized protein LOC141590203 [Silene latifolia]|uniref:uncharacterized protein LOC141590203 n=1 Tax=Silene latifolia TaxID=37657 RepID=UPI003D76FD1F
MYFDGAARQDGAGAGVVFVTPQNHLMPYAFTLTQLCTNNTAEYQALIFGLQMTIEIGVKDMDIYGDSKLVVNQVLGEFEVKKEDLIPYHQQALQLLNQLDDIHVGHVPRSANKLADALANLAATLALGAEESMKVPICNRWVVSSLEGEENVDTTNMICVYTVDEDDQVNLSLIFWTTKNYPMIPDTSDHQSGPKLHDRVKRMGYYRPTMVHDCMDFAKKCEPCQFYANFIHQPSEPLHPTVSSWPFESWGHDVVGPLTPKASNGHEKVVAKSKRDWHERIGEALWAYRTTYKTPTQATPYALVYGVEAVLPLELHIPSLRIAIQEGLTDDENDKLRLTELEALDEKRLEAQQKLQCYQARLSHAFNKKVRPRSFQVGDLVLAVRRPIITSHKPVGKFTSKWDGPYVVQEVYTNGAYKIVDEDGVRVGPINGKFLKRYYS